MNDMEAKAFKLCLLWEKLSLKEFPDYSHVKLRKNGDPRKSALFRHCYKLIIGTKGLIKDSDYKHYIMAQLHVYKSLPEHNALIDPIILNGKKAWKRWKFWNYHFKKKDLMPESVVIKACPGHVIDSLKKTREFLFVQFLGVPDEATYNSKKKKIVNWILQNKISPYYAVLSPFFKKLNIELTIDLNVYKNSINEEIIKYFEAEFNYEFIK